MATYTSPATLAYERSYPTPFANSPLLAALLVSLSVQKHSPEVSSTFDDEYDYIVVGAGAAGAVVANRLSELECATVLLLEAGKSPPQLTEVPGSAHAYIDTDVDWKYVTEPQKYAGHAFNENRVKYPRGKMLGGCTTHNTLQYVRGNRKNYDDWAAAGATGWSYEEVLPYFKKSEKNLTPWYYRNGYHGTGGPLTVSEVRYDGEIKNPLTRAVENQGYDVVDPNGPTQTGIYTTQATYKEGQRVSTAKAYLVPADDRENLDILTKALVTQIAIENHRAYGVVFDYGNSSYLVRARKEVILSAGSLNTPQLLMLSGIGPADQLRRFGIPVIADLPVGKFMQDHCATLQPFELSSSIEPFDAKMKNPLNIMNYIKYKTGPLASCGGRAIENFINGTLSSPYRDFPPLEVYFTETSARAMKGEYGMKEEVYKQVFEPHENKSMYLCQAQHVQPESRGYVRLQSASIYDPPIMDPNYLSHPQDLEHLIAGMRFCNVVGTSAPMRAVGSKPFKEKYPGCEGFVMTSDAYLRCVARMTCSTFHHQSGTTRMGRYDDPDTVVDSQLRVKSICGLRVADASVMPKITSGNTMIPTIMIAEKASDMIKQTQGGCQVKQPSTGHAYAYAAARG